MNCNEQKAQEPLLNVFEAVVQLSIWAQLG